MDRKFGRLFTQEDVERLLDRVGREVADNFEPLDLPTEVSNEEVREVTLRRAREVVNLSAVVEPEFPQDEPLFLLRGQDLFAPVAIRAYAEHLLEQGDHGMAGEVDEALQAIRLWQRANPSRVKLPD